MMKWLTLHIMMGRIRKVQAEVGVLVGVGVEDVQAKVVLKKPRPKKGRIKCQMKKEEF